MVDFKGNYVYSLCLKYVVLVKVCIEVYNISYRTQCVVYFNKYIKTTDVVKGGDGSARLRFLQSHVLEMFSHP